MFLISSSTVVLVNSISVLFANLLIMNKLVVNLDSDVLLPQFLQLNHLSGLGDLQ
tara:strand:+ start:384 stop:548 length:165 start_codon:yes stop_codon:yes gene_type:complete